ncbi:MAG: RsmE family RNA methyltransferase, partial [Rhodospirillales bacterium]|nr:RsmE family RNA methyltransferase [Rhodospirillales bacterium]
GDWPPERRLLVCDPEARSTMAEAVEGDSGASWAILIGPEGGFAPAERRLLADHPAVAHARMGPRILRAETAVAAALACWQTLAGDWR